MEHKIKHKKRSYDIGRRFRYATESWSLSAFHRNGFGSGRYWLFVDESYNSFGHRLEWVVRLFNALYPQGSPSRAARESTRSLQPQQPTTEERNYSPAK